MFFLIAHLIFLFFSVLTLHQNRYIQTIGQGELEEKEGEDNGQK